MHHAHPLPLNLIKLIISQVPGISLAPDTKALGDIINGHPVEVVMIKLLSSQLNAAYFETTFGGQAISLYQFLDAGKGMKAGQTYQMMNAMMEMGEPFVAPEDTPDTYVLRYAPVPKRPSINLFTDD